MSMEFLPPELAGDKFEKPKREYRGGPVGPRPRSEEQMAWDDAFIRAYNSDTQVLAVQVAPDAAKDAAKRVDSAARFHGLATTAGVPKPGRQEGTVILTWKVRVPKKRTPATSEGETPEPIAENTSAE